MENIIWQSLWDEWRRVSHATPIGGPSCFITRQLPFLSERIRGVKQWQATNLSKVATQWHGWELNPQPSSYKAELFLQSHVAIMSMLCRCVQCLMVNLLIVRRNAPTPQISKIRGPQKLHLQITGKWWQIEQNLRFRIGGLHLTLKLWPNDDRDLTKTFIKILENRGRTFERWKF